MTPSSPPSPDAVVEAARRVLDGVAADPRYGRTSHLHVRLGGRVVVDEHLRGPARGDLFSVTKTVLALVLGVAAARGLLPPLDAPVAAVLPSLRGTPAEQDTWRGMLSMTRGAAVDGPWEVDEVTALPGGQVAHLAAAPRLGPPGERFRYDNGASHLLSAAAGALLGEPVAAFADRELFAPLGVAAPQWLTDPDGVPFGYGHLRLGAGELGLLGQLLLDGGRHHGRTLVDPGFLAEMTRPHSAGGPPEHLPYGLHLWLDGSRLLAGGWAGQHVLVVPAAAAVVVTTSDPGFTFGPPPQDEMPADWAPALTLVRRHLLPVLDPGPASAR